MTTLYHLVSNQVWQNLLPILAYRPKKVVQIRSKGKIWEQSEKNLIEAVRQYQLGNQEIEFETIPLKNDFPAIEEVLEILVRRHKALPANILNFTGGTKLISIGSYRFAQEHGIPSFYYDSRYGEFDGRTGCLPNRQVEYEEVAKKIKVVVALAAHGYTLHGNGYESMMSDGAATFATKVCQIMANNTVVIKQWLKECTSRLFDYKEKWLAESKLRNVLLQPLPRANSEMVQEFIHCAIDAGLLVVDLIGAVRLDPSPSVAKKHFQILQGGWWELYVAKRYKESNRYSDVIWNVVGEGETDVLAFDRANLSVVVTSCKSGYVKKPLEHVESLTKRAEKMGGQYARPVLAVYEEPSDELISHCTKNKVKLLVGADLREVKI
jgi:hypothetical protein